MWNNNIHKERGKVFLNFCESRWSKSKKNCLIVCICINLFDLLRYIKFFLLKIIIFWSVQWTGDESMYKREIVVLGFYLLNLLFAYVQFDICQLLCVLCVYIYFCFIAWGIPLKKTDTLANLYYQVGQI